MSKELLSVQLKAQTATHHQLLEKQLVPLIKAIRTTGEYSRLLMLFYTYFGAIEIMVDGKVNTGCIQDYPQRRKTASLANDLQSMNVTKEPFATGNHLPTIQNHLQATGSLYVTEGSTLGGLHISKMISEQLDMQSTGAFSFFDGYKNETLPMWNAFKKAIDKMPLSKSEDAVVIDTANETFLLFGEWIRQH